MKNVVYVFCRPEESFWQITKECVWKKGIPDVFVGAVMCLNEGARTRFRVDSGLSEEFEVNVGMHQGSMLSPFLLSVVVDVVNESVSERVC